MYTMRQTACATWLWQELRTRPNGPASSDRRGAKPEDEWTLDSFEKKDGALATAADFYLDPDAPPEEPCNRYNEPYGMLRYFLRWDTPYSGMDHDFRLIVYDAAGNSETKYLSDSDTVNDPMVEISTETVGSMVRLCWTLPGDWQIDHFNLSRGREGNQIDSCANEAPIPRHDTSGRVITHHCYEDPFPEGDDWVCLFYTLTATWVSGETTQIGRARVLNPLHCVTRDLSVYPNPFADTVEFRFVNSGEEHVHVSVYDVGGRLVKEVLNCRMPEGPASVYWDGTDAHGATVSPGVYFVGVASGRMTEVAKITLVR